MLGRDAEPLESKIAEVPVSNISLEPLDKAVVMPCCSHPEDPAELIKWAKGAKTFSCPFCREEHATNKIYSFTKVNLSGYANLSTLIQEAETAKKELAKLKLTLSLFQVPKESKAEIESKLELAADEFLNKQKKKKLAVCFKIWKQNKDYNKLKLLKKDFYAAIANDDREEMFKLFQHILSNGLLNECDENGYTPLMFAVSRGRHAISEFLLRKFADPNQTSKMGGIILSPLRIAITCLVHPSIIALLFQYDADINQVSEDKMTPLSFALCNLQEKHSEYIKILLEAKPDIRNDKTLNEIIMPQLKSKKRVFYDLVNQYCDPSKKLSL